ncbi:hypothetical protein [Vibrio sp. Vb2201]|uniref:hypothetical protein n=1 Tax=Vibrio sp. Vb2201 TaxID=3074655 RepID=UPI00296519B4|nr:hypothetical protein [Vibrio sp. Vb2201]MDW1798966.1 hypothetical protein [Vibrio sp. Vb2201]
MGETANIAKMASCVSDEMFEVFKWKRKIVQDHSWECVTPEDHGGKADHPSDCVFYYRDPYDNEMKYVNTDLKSYAKGSITKTQIRKAMHSLTYATNCAQYNQNWKDLFTPEASHTVKGMLFVYNHCGTFNGSFTDIINDINEPDGDKEYVNHLDGYGQVYVMSPYKIVELNSVASDIRMMIAKQELPFSGQFCFFHPSEMLNKNHFSQDYSEPATLEVLFSSWIIIKHAATNKTDAGYVVYYMQEGNEVDEFVYLLDALSYYQILNDKGSVRIKLVKKNQHAVLKLREAVGEYFRNLGYDDERIEELQKRLAGETIAKVIPQFSEVEVGLMD